MKPEIEKIYQESLSKLHQDTLAHLTDEDVLRMLTEIRLLKDQLASQTEVITRLRRESLHDPMTGLPNRRYFEQELDRALKYYNRYKRSAALLVIDANDFKTINDSLGHLAGDAILRHIAQLVSSNIRETDFAARIGGDEFCVILREVTAERAAEKARQISEVISRTPCRYEGRDVYVSVSVGHCPFTRSGDKHDLFERADQAMYIAKADAKAVA